jgi:hypothetical protein
MVQQNPLGQQAVSVLDTRRFQRPSRLPSHHSSDDGGEGSLKLWGPVQN